MIPGWLDEIEREVLSCLGGGSWHPHGLAGRLGVSERCAIGYVTMLGLAGRLVIELVASRVGGPSEGPPPAPAVSPGLPGPDDRLADSGGPAAPDGGAIMNPAGNTGATDAPRHAAAA